MNATYNKLIEWASTFPMLRFRLVIELQEPCRLPVYKGSMWHGLLGHVLKKGHQGLFDLCYGEDSHQMPKPYLVVPEEGDDILIKAQAGDQLGVEFRFFGHLTAFQAQIMHSLSLCEHFGLGKDNASFALVSLSEIHTEKSQHIPSLSHHLNESLLHSFALADVCRAKIETPVRIKKHGNILTEKNDDVAFWLHSMQRRIRLLDMAWGKMNHALIKDIFDAYQAQYITSRSLTMISRTHFEDWQRYSARQNESISFGGLKGQLTFYGDIHNMALLLHLAEFLHIGNKSTFGLGRITLIA